MEPVDSADGVLEQYVLYARPRECPDGYVVRRWLIIRGNPEPVPDRTALRFDSVQQARAWMDAHYPDLVRLTRHPDDDPTIVEVYT